MAKSNTAVVPFEKKRNQILAEMTPAMQKVAKDFDVKIEAMARGTVMICYDMSARLKDVASKPDLYGQDAIDQLAAYMPPTMRQFCTPTALGELKMFADEWSKDDVLKLANRPMSTGDHISYAHFRALMKVKSKKDQKALIDRVFVEGMSAGELENKIKAEVDRKNERHGGRHPVEPSSPLAALYKGFTTAQKLSNYLDVLIDKVFHKLSELTPDDVDEKYLARIDEFEAEAVETVEKLEKAQKKIVPIKERMLRVMQKREERAEANGKAEADETVPVRPPRTGKKKVKKGKEKRRRPAPV